MITWRHVSRTRDMSRCHLVCYISYHVGCHLYVHLLSNCDVGVNVSVATAAAATAAEAEFHEGIASDAIVDPDETREDVEEVRAKQCELGLWLDEDEQDFHAFHDDNIE